MPAAYLINTLGNTQVSNPLETSTSVRYRSAGAGRACSPDWSPALWFYFYY
jgi:hypothetical protein